MNFNVFSFISEMGKTLSGRMPKRQQSVQDMNAMIMLGNRLEAVIEGDDVEPSTQSPWVVQANVDPGFNITLDEFICFVDEALGEQDILLRERRKQLLNNDFLNAYYALARPSIKATENMGLDAWLKSDDVGLSSLFMAKKLSNGQVHSYKGEPIEFAIPHDVDDFQRCQKLLVAAPEIKPHFQLMKKEGPRWSALVASWDDISDLVNDNKNSEAYNLILSCIK